MPVIASVTIPKVRINPGSRTFGPYPAPASPINGIRLTSLRNTTANPGRRGDNSASSYRVLFEGQVLATGAWTELGAFASRGGVYVLKGDPDLRQFKGKVGEELAADVFSSGLAEPTVFSNLRVTVTTSGGRYEAEATVELLGP